MSDVAIIKEQNIAMKVKSGNHRVADLNGTAAYFKTPVVKGSTVTTKNTAGGVTLTITEILGGVILADPNGASRTYTLPTITLILATLTKYQVGQFFEFVIRNTADAGAEILTVAAGTGGSASGTMTIQPGQSRRFGLRIDSATAYTVYDLTGSGTIDVSGLATGLASIQMADNLASAFAIREAATDYLKFVTTDSSEGITMGVSLTIADAKNIILNTTTGTKIGTSASQKLGFFNATPIVQPSGAAQAALTDSSGGTGDGTVEAVGATNGSDVSGAINNNFKEVCTLLNAIQTALVNLGLIKGAA